MGVFCVPCTHYFLFGGSTKTTKLILKALDCSIVAGPALNKLEHWFKFLSWQNHFQSAIFLRVKQPHNVCESLVQTSRGPYYLTQSVRQTRLLSMRVACFSLLLRACLHPIHGWNYVVHVLPLWEK